MKRIIIAAVIALASALALGAECPPIKHCPPGTKCRPETVCPPCAKCPECRTCPQPPDCHVSCPECPNLPEIPPCKPSIVYVPQKQAERVGSRWLLNLSAGWLPSHDYAGAWDQSVPQKRVDPNFELHADSGTLLGAGITWQHRSRWQLTAQALYLDRGDTSIKWTHKPSLRGGDQDGDDPPIKDSALRVDDDGSDWGYLISIGIPLGKR